MQKTYDLIVPIGSKCKVSHNLRRCGLQLESFPFDWIYIKSPAVIENLFATDFKNFFREENLRLRSKQPKFDEVDDLGTGIYSAHDFDTNRSIHDCYPEVIAKFNRRIAKLKGKLNEAKTLLIVFAAEGDFLSDAEMVAEFTALQKQFPKQQVDFLYLYLSEEKIEFERKLLASNILKISFQREKDFEWQGNPKYFNRALKGFRLAFKTKIRWYTSSVYLNGLKKKAKIAFLKFLSNLIVIKKYRKKFREKYLEKRNKFQ